MITASEAFSTVYPYLERDALLDVLGTSSTPKLNELACIDLLFDLINAKTFENRNAIYKKLSEISHDELAELKFAFEDPCNTVFKNRTRSSSQPFLRHYAACALLLLLENRLHELDLLLIPRFQEKVLNAYTHLIDETNRIKNGIKISALKFLYTKFSRNPELAMHQIKESLKEEHLNGLSVIKFKINNSLMVEAAILFAALTFFARGETPYILLLLLGANTLFLMHLLLKRKILLDLIAVNLNEISAQNGLPQLIQLEMNVKLKHFNETHPDLPASLPPNVEIPEPKRLKI